tara:strand:+ start:143 stop:346 length:204 start_codon:yes stop_codon:yes gene_type:complete
MMKDEVFPKEKTIRYTRQVIRACSRTLDDSKADSSKLNLNRLAIINPINTTIKSRNFIIQVARYLSE